ncbi:hypothetical protein [Rhodobaculum claviforme]|uniref:Inner membrane protein n=1 Tax=Rhodobaculum claviforme TaxID=1549854 RepID=A0A934TJ25_9RHOB|nr:hypothetical protein [Rhodobaculum claviforme]MBK5926559.1 hypothetical protein [Rhodobaculum claviforme]
MASPNDTPHGPKTPSDDGTDAPGTARPEEGTTPTPREGAVDWIDADPDARPDAAPHTDDAATEPTAAQQDAPSAGTRDADAPDGQSANGQSSDGQSADGQTSGTAEPDAADAGPEPARDGTPDTTDTGAAGDDVAPSAAALAANAGAAAGLAASAAAGDTTDRDHNRDRGAAAPADRPRGSAMPMVLGGVIAAGLGAGALWWLDREGVVTLSGADLGGMAAQIERQSARLGAMEQGVSQLEGGLATQGDRLDTLEAAVADTPGTDALADLSARTDTLAETVAALEARIAEIDDLPLASDPEARAILQGFRDEVSGLRAELQQASERADALIAAAEAEAARADAAEAELGGIAAEAATAEAMARARSALRLVQAAFANGGSFAGPIAVIEDIGVEIPTTLALMAEEGVPTPTGLMDSYPEAAREALQIALRDVTDKTLPERMTAFLRLQFGMRSVTPREGSDADAILSRAEAALLAGALDEVLAEIATLPPQARMPLEGWAARVETRREAEAALSDLSARIDQF